MNQAKLSVIIATFNSAQFIERAVKSILNQTYSNFEIIIIDGLSTDETSEIVLGFGTSISKFISERDIGIYDAFNKGVQYATGDWICFLGSDDTFYNNEVFQSLMHHFHKADEGGFGYIYGQALIVQKNGMEIELAGFDWERASKTFHKAMNINHCGAFTRAEVFKNHGSFNTDFKIAGDYDFLLRAFRQGVKPYFVNMPFVKMQTGGISNNFKLKILLIKEVMLAQKLNGYNHYNVRVVLWYLKIRVSNLIYLILGERVLYALADFIRMLCGKEKKWTQE